jgi:hypothetical protein
MHPTVRFLRSSSSIAFATALLAAAAIGIAAPTAAPGNPLQVLAMSLMYESDPSGALNLTMRARLPEDTALPAQMVLPLPPDAQVLQAAEYLEDEGRAGASVVAMQETRDGVPALVFTLAESLAGTAELRLPNARVASPTAGEQYEAGFAVALPVAAEYVYAAVAIPASEGEVRSTDPSISYVSEVQPDGRLYYFVEAEGAAAGDEVRLFVDYHEGWVDESVPWLLGIVVLTIVGAGAALVIRRRRTNKDAPEVA